MITMTSCDRASTKPGQMSMLERRWRREGGAGQEADLAADLLHRLAAALRDVLVDPRQIGLDVAQMPTRVVMPERAAARLREAREHRLELDLLLGQPQQQRLLGAHLVGQRAEALGEREEVGVGGDAALLAAPEDALQVLEAVGGLLH